MGRKGKKGRKLTREHDASACVTPKHGVVVPPVNGRNPSNSETKTAIHDELRVFEAKMEALEAKIPKKEPRWLRPSVIVAGLALALAGMTTIIAEVRVAQQGTHNAKLELRALLNRLGELEREALRLHTRTRDPAILNPTLSSIGQEQMNIGHQAVELVDKLPDSVLSGELLSIAKALSQSPNRDYAERMITLAANRAATILEKAHVLRNHAWFLFLTGRSSAGRKEFNSVLGMLNDPGSKLTLDEAVSQRAYTHAAWAQEEKRIGNDAAWIGHATTARELVDAISDPGLKITTQSNLSSMLTYLEQARRMPSTQESQQTRKANFSETDNRKAFTSLMEFVNEGAALYKQGKLEQATIRFSEGIDGYTKLYAESKRPVHGRVLAATLVNRGVAYRDLERLDEAESDFTHAYETYFELIRTLGLTELVPDAALARTHRGYVYFLRKRYEDAMKEFDNALYVAPTNAQALLFRGKVKLAVGDLSGARIDWQAAMNASPDDASTREHARQLLLQNPLE